MLKYKKVQNAEKENFDTLSTMNTLDGHIKDSGRKKMEKAEEIY